MVYRLSPENVRPPRGGPSGAGAVAVVLLLVVGIWVFAGGDPGSQARSASGEPIPTQLPSEGAPSTDPVSGLPYVAPADLPPDALDLFVELTGDSPPDGEPYDNADGLLPPQASGYYTEHLVLPAGVDEVSSAGRIVLGRGDEAYWTDDGGVSFARIGP